jgi:CRP-like cAMP-binding protein
MDKTRAFELASTQGWLAQLPEDFRNRFLSQAVLKSVEAGTVLFDAGDFNSSMVGLVEGILELSWDHPQLNRHLIHFARPGFWMGDGLAYGLPNRMVSARAKTQVTLLCLPRKRTEDLIAEDPRCLAYFGRLTMMHVEACLKIIGELMYRDPLVRVSARLVTMSDSHLAGKPTGVVTLNVTQDELATLSNMSRKSLNRALGALRTAGVVEPHYGHVAILDFDKLIDIASARIHVAPIDNLSDEPPVT